MGNYKVVYGNLAKESLTQDYASILDNVSDELSETEYRHLSDIANIGYEQAARKSDYVEALHDTVFDWIAEARRAQFYLVEDSAENDFHIWYNDNIGVKESMQSNQNLSSIPSFFVFFGAVSLALFCIFTTILVMGICHRSFPINPVYLFMFAFGFLGLLLTDITAIIEWRRTRNEPKRSKH